MRIKNFIRKNYKLVIGFIIGGIVFGGIGVYAVTTKEVSYDNSTSKLTSTNMQGAIDELNEKATKPCRVIKGTGTSQSDEIKCGTEEFYVLYTSGDSINVVTKYPIEGGCASIDQGGACASQMANPSFAQNENCGKTIMCGLPNVTKYKDVLKNIGLSDTITVSNLTIENMNRAGCSISSSYTSDNGGSYTCSGNCSSTNLSWIKGISLFGSKTETNYGIAFPELITKDLTSSRAVNPNYNMNTVLHAMVTIPITDILIK